MDAWIVKLLNSGVGKFELWDALIESLMSDYFVPVTCSLAMIGLWFRGPKPIDRESNQIIVCIAAGAIGLSNLLIAIFNSFYFRLRPFELQDLNLLFYEPTDSSFPANFSAVGFAVATSIFLKHKKLGAFLALLAILGGGGRVYAGVHYPTDIVAGAVIGAGSAYIAYLVSKRVSIILRLFLRLARKIYFA